MHFQIAFRLSASFRVLRHDDEPAVTMRHDVPVIPKSLLASSYSLFRFLR